MTAQRLRVLAKLAREARRLSDIKPTRVENEVDTENFSCKGGELNVMSTRFSTRVMASHNQVRLRGRPTPIIFSLLDPKQLPH
jgi:hypothetical protein